jgi:uncharacterized phage-associated protein
VETRLAPVAGPGYDHVMSTSPEFAFDELKSVQACAVLMGSKVPSSVNYTKLLKLLYLADRKSLLDTGRPVTGAKFVLMKHGPVLSEVYECIKERAAAGSTWDEYIRRDEYQLVLCKLPGDTCLSDYEVETLESLAAEYADHDYMAMIDVTHALPEWKNPAPSKVVALPVARVIEAGGMAVEEIIALSAQRDYLASVDQALHTK